MDRVYIFSSTFIQCHGKDSRNGNTGGGAVFLNDTKQCHQIHDCDFIGCYSGADGGALHLRNSEVTQTDGVANTRFVGCKTLLSRASVEGGAVQSYNVAVTCHFSNCLTVKCTSYLCGGYLIQVRENSAVNMIVFSFFHDNYATDTGNDVGITHIVQTNNVPLFSHCFSTTTTNRLSYYYNTWFRIVVDWFPHRNTVS